MEIPDLSHLTILGVMTFTALITLVDVVAAYVAAGIQGKFDLSFVSAWLTSHSSKRVIPIFALAWLGHGVPQVDIPEIPALFAMATAGVGTYLLETVKSLLVNFRDATPVKDETPVPPIGPVAS